MGQPSSSARATRALGALTGNARKEDPAARSQKGSGGNAATVDRLFDRVCAWISLTVGAAAFLIALMVTYAVVARELFGASDPGVSEISAYIMGYITFVGAASGIWEGAHVGVEFLTGRLKGPARVAVLGLANVLLTLVAIVFAWLAFRFWLDAWRSGEVAWGAVAIPLWIPYSAMLAGTLLFVFFQLARLVTGRFLRQKG